MAEQCGLVRSGGCWCRGGLGLCTDDCDVVEPCALCRRPAGLAGFPGPSAEADLDEAAAALRRAIDEMNDDCALPSKPASDQHRHQVVLGKRCDALCWNDNSERLDPTPPRGEQDRPATLRAELGSTAPASVTSMSGHRRSSTCQTVSRSMPRCCTSSTSLPDPAMLPIATDCQGGQPRAARSRRSRKALRMRWMAARAPGAGMTARLVPGPLSQAW